MVGSKQIEDKKNYTFQIEMKKHHFRAVNNLYFILIISECVNVSVSETSYNVSFVRRFFPLK